MMCSLQDGVTETVVNAIAPRIEQAEIERSKSKPAERLDAYDYNLRGIARLNLIYIPSTEPGATLTASREARALFLQATAIDPDFARAYALAANCCLIESQNVGATSDRRAIVSEATRLSRLAAVLGKEDAVALGHAAQALAYVAGEIDEGSVLIERAIALNPNLALAWNFGGWMKIFRGEPEQAIERFSRAMRLNPLDPYLFLMDLGMACGHLFIGDHTAAVDWADKALLERPRALVALRLVAVCFALGGRPEEARNIAVKAHEIAPHFRIAQVRSLFPLRRGEDLMKYCEGLRLAGFPD